MPAHRSVSDVGSTVSSLLNEAKKNNPAAWRDLVNLYGPLAYHWCRRSGLEADDAADVVQEVFGAVTANLSRFRKERDGDSFRGWLFTITRNKIRDLARTRQGKPAAAGGSDAQHRLAEVPEQHDFLDDSVRDLVASWTPLIQAIELIQSEVEEPTWEAFWRTTVEQRTSSEVGQELGMSANAVRLAKGRVLRRLREELGNQGA